MGHRPCRDRRASADVVLAVRRGLPAIAWCGLPLRCDAAPPAARMVCLLGAASVPLACGDAPILIFDFPNGMALHNIGRVGPSPADVGRS
jgi:hypothetical protein